MAVACAAAAVPQMLVAIADQLAWQVEQLCRFDVRRTAQDMTTTVRNERERTRPQHAGVRTRDFEPTLACSHDVKHHAILHRRKVQRPRRRELRQAIEGAAHAQEVQRFADWISRRLPGFGLVKIAAHGRLH